MIDAQQHALIPIIQVAYPYDKWWSIPPETSLFLYNQYRMGLNASFTWDWGPHGRTGSYICNGVATQYSRYTIDFENMVQINSDNHRIRTVRIAWTRPQDTHARFDGQIIG